jgi:hypothetical protein
LAPSRLENGAMVLRMTPHDPFPERMTEQTQHQLTQKEYVWRFLRNDGQTEEIETTHKTARRASLVKKEHRHALRKSPICQTAPSPVSTSPCLTLVILFSALRVPVSDQSTLKFQCRKRGNDCSDRAAAKTSGDAETKKRKLQSSLTQRRIEGPK